MRGLVRGAGGCAVVVGAAVLLGWAAGTKVLTTVLPGQYPMAPVGAVALVAGGGGLLLVAAGPRSMAARFGRVLSAVMAGVGAMVLAEYLTGRSLGIDRVLYGGALAVRGVSGRPAAATAVLLLVLGLALVLIDAGRAGGYRPGVILAVPAAVLAVATVLGWLFGVSFLGDPPAGDPVSPAMALTLPVLAVGTLAARPERQPVRAFLDAGPGGRLARRLAPLLLAALSLIALFSGRDARATPGGGTLPALLATLAAVGALLGVVAAVVLGLNRADRESQHTQSVLADQQDFTAALLGNLQDGVLITDGEMRVRAVNDRWCEMTGWARDDILGHAAPHPWWPPESVDKIEAQRRAIMGDGKPVVGEAMFRRADGTPLWVVGSLVQIRGPAGTPPAYVTVVSDITRLKRADARFQTLLESAPDAMILLDSAGLVSMANARAEQLLGQAGGPLVGRPLDSLLAEHERPGHRARLAGYLAARGDQPARARYEVAFLRPDGTEFPGEVSVVLLDDEQEVQLCGAIRDITERKQAEQALRDEREQTARIITSAADPFVSLDADGAVIAWNASAERVFGWPAAEAIGRPLTGTIIPAEASETYHGALDRALGRTERDDLDRRIEISARHRSGRAIPIEVTVWADPAAEGKRFHAFMHDRTERLHLLAERDRANALAHRQEQEAQLQQVRRMESLGQLAGGVAHDFNNLLAVIVNYLDFVAEEVDAASRQEPDRWATTSADIGQIKDATQRAQRLTRQLLTFGRRDIAQPGVLDIDEVVAGNEDFLRRTIGAHIDLAIRRSADLWPVVADRGQVEQVLVNLAVNARDAMPHGGTLIIETGNVVADEQYVGGRPGHPTGRYVRLQVGDTGSGMTPDVMDRAFEPFFTTKSDGGTGLGLATVHGILKQAGGHASIYSEPTLGTTVNALWPASADRTLTTEPEEVVEVAVAGVGRTVLVVEDETSLREVTARILTRNGFRVLTASHGAEAISTAEREPAEIHLLLTDVIMPNMFGKALAAEIRARRPGIPVLFMSGYAQPVLAAQGTLDPGVHLLSKPFSERDLLNRIGQVLNGDQPASHTPPLT